MNKCIYLQKYLENIVHWAPRQDDYIYILYYKAMVDWGGQ